MMKSFFSFVLSVCVLMTGYVHAQSETKFIKKNFKSADRQIRLLLDNVKGDSLFPRTIDAQGNMVSTNMYDWTPGFFPGILWYAYQYSSDPAMKAAAIQWTEKLEALKDFKDHHDLGFMMYCSYGNAYRLTGNELYMEHLIQAAKSLSTRFDSTVGCIKSWNSFRSWHGNKVYNYPVIIDNMMNLELLFFATRFTGDSSFYRTAITHADVTLKNQFRDDFSSYHVVCYDTATGLVVGRETAQGYADNSTWSRGQAWAIYGYTMTYRETKDPKYLDAARGMANWYLNHTSLPADKVPFWDFNFNDKGYVPGVNSYALQTKLDIKDASAASIIASALFELSTYGGEMSKQYKSSAIAILHSLAGETYRSTEGTNGNFLLKHSVGSIPHKAEIDVPLVYADYYFMEALHRYRLLQKGKPLF